jgi:hypothetical protein
MDHRGDQFDQAPRFRTEFGDHGATRLPTNYFGEMRVMPRMYGCNASGIITEPSCWRLFSMIAAHPAEKQQE